MSIAADMKWTSARASTGLAAINPQPLHSAEPNSVEHQWRYPKQQVTMQIPALMAANLVP